MGRNILSGIIGIVLGMVTVASIDRLSHLIYMPPLDIDPTNKGELREMVLSMPSTALLVIFMAHLIGAFVASLISAKFASKNKFLMGLLAGAVILIATITRLSMIPHPIYLSLLDVFLTLIGMYAGARIGSAGEVILDN